MKKIVIKNHSETVELSKVNEYSAIFAKKNGDIIGMVIEDPEGWIVRLGSNSGANGHHPTLKECIESCWKYGYEFFTH